MTSEPENGALTLRLAGPADLPDLLALYRHLNPDDPPLDLAEATRLMADLVSRPGCGVHVGTVNGRLVTTCTLVVIPNLTRGGAPYGLVENVVTDAAYRGRGHARAVLDAAVAAAWDRDCYKVMLLTGSRDPATLRFYACSGFEQNKTGFQIRRLPVRGESAV